MAKTFFLTTAIDYTNGAPHIGHAYEKILADVIVRYQRLKGEETFFLTGVDQHGQKVQQSAEKQGVPPQQFVDEITAKFRALWKKLDVKHNKRGWAETTHPLHKKCVRDILDKLWNDTDPATGASRWIYKKTGCGWYSVRQEQFITDKERNEQGEFGPEWQPVEEREEENFYFRLRDCKEWLRGFIKKRSEQGRPFVVPDFRVAELLNAVEKIEGDLCISRPVSRLKWGIPFPESWGEGFVTYVWFDALVNYISFSGFDPHAPGSGAAEETSTFDSGLPTFSELWPALQIIGKDILIPAHGIYWSSMLHALGFTDEEMPTLLVHGWWNIGGAKMSKSTGNIVDPDALADKYGAEALRYYLMSDIATGRDADFSEERLVQRYNTDLANSLGNLLNRSLNMAWKYREGKLKRGDAETRRIEGTTNFDQALAVYVEHFDGAEADDKLEPGEVPPGALVPTFAIHQALDVPIGVAAVHCNGMIEREKPWALAKDPAQADRLDAVLYTLAESLRIIAILISPVLPRAAHGIFDQLQWKLDEAGEESRFSLNDAKWGGLPDGHVVGKPVPLFPRIEAPAN